MEKGAVERGMVEDVERGVAKGQTVLPMTRGGRRWRFYRSSVIRGASSARERRHYITSAAYAHVRSNSTARSAWLLSGETKVYFGWPTVCLAVPVERPAVRVAVQKGGVLNEGRRQLPQACRQEPVVGSRSSVH